MSPHGVVIWLLAAATWAVLGGVGFLVWRFRRPRPTVAPAPAQARMLPAPARPDLDEYTDDVPASGAAWAVGPAPDENEGR